MLSKCGGLTWNKEIFPSKKKKVSFKKEVGLKSDKIGNLYTFKQKLVWFRSIRYRRRKFVILKKFLSKHSSKYRKLFAELKKARKKKSLISLDKKYAVWKGLKTLSKCFKAYRYKAKSRPHFNVIVIPDFVWLTSRDVDPDQFKISYIAHTNIRFFRYGLFNDYYVNRMFFKLGNSLGPVKSKKYFGSLDARKARGKKFLSKFMHIMKLPRLFFFWFTFLYSETYNYLFKFIWIRWLKYVVSTININSISDSIYILYKDIFKSYSFIGNFTLNFYNFNKFFNLLLIRRFSNRGYLYIRNVNSYKLKYISKSKRRYMNFFMAKTYWSKKNVALKRFYTYRT